MEAQTPSTHTYTALLASIKQRIQSAQVRAAVAVNRELVLLYWGIGNEILARQSAEGWGKNIIPRLAKDLAVQFPEMKGLSPRNLFATACCKIAVGPQCAPPRLPKKA